MYNDIDGNLDGAFNLVDSLDLFGLRVTIAGADLDLNGKEEIIYGEYAGGMSIMTYGIPSFLSTNNFDEVPRKIMVYPNPATNELKIKLPEATNNQIVAYEVFNLYGKKVANGTMRNQ